ncbi:MAG TPA: hypothetical protein VGP26_27425 [Actinophytocola sp.]|jgi:hypothetical protein|nr:hypothetical protein [Actinophytocola sp.]
MVVLVRRIRSAIFPVVLDDSWPRLLVYALFWLSTAVLAAVLLIADPVFGSFVVGIPLLLVVLVRERGLEGIPPLLFGAAIGSSLVFSIFLGQYRGVFDDGVLIAGLVVFLVWVGTYPVMLRQMDRQYLQERFSRVGGAPPARAPSVVRLYVVRVWMTLLAAGVLAASLARVVAGS